MKPIPLKQLGGPYGIAFTKALRHAVRLPSQDADEVQAWSDLLSAASGRKPSFRRRRPRGQRAGPGRRCRGRSTSSLSVARRPRAEHRHGRLTARDPTGRPLPGPCEVAGPPRSRATDPLGTGTARSRPFFGTAWGPLPPTRSRTRTERPRTDRPRQGDRRLDGSSAPRGGGDGRHLLRVQPSGVTALPFASVSATKRPGRLSGSAARQRIWATQPAREIR